MDFAPQIHRDKEFNRVYSEMSSGTKWLEVQKRLPEGATVMAVVVGSDATKLTQLGGDKKAWPVYVSLGNIHLRTRRTQASECLALVAYLPELRGTKKEKTSEAWSTARRRLFHDMLRAVFAPLMKYSTTYVVGAGGFMRCHT